MTLVKSVCLSLAFLTLNLSSTPKKTQSLMKMADLFLFDNNFSGALPEEIGKLGNLYNLYINDNKV